jgi:tRNA pseudouridine65 synthase
LTHDTPVVVRLEEEFSNNGGLRGRAKNANTRGRKARRMITVLWQDSAFVAVDKPSGLAVHRGMCADPITALEMTRDTVEQWVYPVHRLDRATSGVLVFGLSSEAARALHDQFENGSVDKRYWALVRGVTPLEGTIEHAIPRCEGGPRVEALTTFRRLWTGAHVSLVEARPRTGRFHQVRRHMKHINHPLIGDANYGKGALNRAYRDEFGLGRLALHAASIAFLHPFTEEEVTIAAALPEDLKRPFERIGVGFGVTGAEGDPSSPLTYLLTPEIVGRHRSKY